MRIVYIINHLGQTGVNNVVLDLVKQMVNHGHDCCVCYFVDHDSPMEFPCMTKKITMRRNSIPLSHFDVVHTHGLKANLWVFRNKPRRCKIHFIATLHCYVFQDFFDLYGNVKGLFLGLLFLLSVLRHDKIVTLSRDAKKYYQKWLSDKKLTYSYNTRDVAFDNGVSECEKNEIEKIRGDGILIGMNCVMLMRKGVDIIIKALMLLPERYRLILVGSGKDEHIFKKMVKDNGLNDRVFFAGNRNLAYRFLPYYDIYALPSRSEGFPLSLLEAAAYGKKVACSDLPIIKECFSADEVAMFHLADEKMLAEAILKIENNDEIGMRLKRRFEMDYSPERFYQRYLTIYNGIG